MRGVVFLGERKLELREFADPLPGPGEVVIAIKASGMCGSDLHAYRARGNAAAALGFAGGGPVIAGHEPCGVVAAVGAGVTAALDCTGSPEARAAAVRGTGTWGRVCFVGEGGTVTLDVSPDLLRRQLTLLASWTFSAVGQEECARFIAERQIPLGRLLTHRFALDQAAEAYRLFDTQTTGKGVFVF